MASITNSIGDSVAIKPKTMPVLKKPTVMFLSYQRTTFTDAFRLALGLKEQNSYEPVFVIAAGTSGLLEREVNRCADHGIACFTEEDLIKASRERLKNENLAPLKSLLPAGAPRMPRLLTRVLSRGRGVLNRLFLRPENPTAGHEPVRVPGSLGHRRYFRGQLWFRWCEIIFRTDLQYDRILKTLEPSVVCLSEDIPGPLTAPLIRAARRRGIPSAIIPFTIPNVLEVFENCLLNPDFEVRSPRDDALVQNFPNWITTYKDRRLLRTAPELIVASECAGIAPPKPFILNSGYADRILVESERMLKVYRDLDFPDGQLTLTGSIADDRLSLGLRHREQRRAALYRELGLPPDRPMLLATLVPDQLVSGVPFCEFTTYPDLVNFWVTTIAACAPKFNVVLKINPRDRLEDYLHLEKLGVKLAPDDTVDLVPLADIFVSSLSSTLRWAAACAIPSVNYDVYHFNYGDYAGAPGILHVEKMKEFIAVIDRLANDDAYRASIRALQMPDAPNWGRLDGQTIERIVATFDKLRTEISGYRPPVRSSHRTVSAINSHAA